MRLILIQEENSEDGRGGDAALATQSGGGMAVV